MKIYSPSQIILSLLAFGILYLGYQNMFNDSGNHNYILLLVVLGLAVYFMRAELDYKYHEKNPVELDPPVINFLEKRHKYYQSLNEENQKKFRDRLSLYIEARMFKGIASEQKSVPEDLKVLISCHAIQMTMAHDDILIGDFDRIILYQHPFGTPNKQFLHIVETELEDGVIILMTPYLLNAINHPDKYYNIAFHAYAEALIKQNPQWDLSGLDKIDWNHVEEVSGFKKDKLLLALGYDQIDLMPILITLYFSHTEKFQEILPEAKKILDGYFAIVNN